MSLKIGDALQTGLRKDWLVVAFGDETAKLLEPAKTLSNDIMSLQGAKEYAEKLQSQGHSTARLPTKKDHDEIILNIIYGGHNDKAELDVSGSNPKGRYWEYTEESEDATVRYLDKHFERCWVKENVQARVRCVQEIPKSDLF